jgi:hypothetical protein
MRIAVARSPAGIVISSVLSSARSTNVRSPNIAPNGGMAPGTQSGMTLRISSMSASLASPWPIRPLRRLRSRTHAAGKTAIT